jgi:uncharacterized protein (TIGR03118 family)
MSDNREAWSARRVFRRLRSRSSRCLAGFALCCLCLTAHATVFSVTNLVTDDQTVNAAQITDPSLKNAWGVSLSPTSPFWVSNNGTGTATLYSVNPATNATVKQGLTVTIPGDGSVTGQAFNTGNASAAANFNRDLFLFVNEDGTVSGWRGALGTTAEVLQLGSADNVYKGAALALIGADAYLYAADFKGAQIDVLKGTAGAPSLTGTFTDPNAPAGFAPFNIALLNGNLYVTYAKVGPTGDDVPGLGNGFVDVFDLQGNLISRLTTGGTLNSPWGLAIAPASFGQFAGDLLVGNFGDGRINAYDPGTGVFLGQLLDSSNAPLTIDGLWALVPGNGGNGGSPNSIYFSAGPGDEQHGLFGVIAAVPEPGTLALLGIAVAGLAFVRRRSRS